MISSSKNGALVEKLFHLYTCFRLSGFCNCRLWLYCQNLYVLSPVNEGGLTFNHKVRNSI